MRATTAELVRAASTDAADDAARASEGGGGLEGCFYAFDSKKHMRKLEVKEMHGELGAVRCLATGSGRLREVRGGPPGQPALP